MYLFFIMVLLNKSMEAYLRRLFFAAGWGNLTFFGLTGSGLNAIMSTMIAKRVIARRGRRRVFA